MSIAGLRFDLQPLLFWHTGRVSFLDGTGYCFVVVGDGVQRDRRGLTRKRRDNLRFCGISQALFT